MDLTSDIEKLDNLDNISWAIYNHLVGALKGTAHEAYPIDQIRAEILVEIASITRQLALSNQLLESSLVQDINCVELDCENLSMCCKVDTYDSVLHFKLPKLSTFVTNPLKFVGTTDRSQSFKIITTSTWKYNSYSKYTKNKPYVWFVNNWQDGFLFNPPTENLKYISVSIIPENFESLSVFSCCDINKNPMIPNWLVSMVMDKIINRFSTTIKNINWRKNDQVGH